MKKIIAFSALSLTAVGFAAYCLFKPLKKKELVTGFLIIFTMFGYLCQVAWMYERLEKYCSETNNYIILCD